jgi:hypothetical protein
MEQGRTVRICRKNLQRHIDSSRTLRPAKMDCPS